ncbi:hypothetical protein EST38_g11623 [Candolleomyces aberdarensis]|uniref:Uncharacterized protein n=1 Tax=Candolleomyces aberdarensis TaxID=2316362 RepID=A0A4V1Q287_9AGAR|nr:hypothetical protein EST38_g11623 [Candolleomyces aberdarensis]
MRALYGAILSTSLGSVLISKVKITSATAVTPPVLEEIPPLPQPDWSLTNPAPSQKSYQELQRENEELRAHLQRASMVHKAQQGVIEGAHAQMIVQNLHLNKLNSALHGKEKQRKSNRTLIIDSTKGQVYTSDEVSQGLLAQEKRKQQKLDDKKARARMRAAKKDAQAKLEEEWTKIKAHHEQNVAEWKGACEKLQQQAVAKKKWPKAPTRPRKPTLSANFGAINEEDNDDEDGPDSD